MRIPPGRERAGLVRPEGRNDRRCDGFGNVVTIQLFFAEPAYFVREHLSGRSHSRCKLNWANGITLTRIIAVSAWNEEEGVRVAVWKVALRSDFAPIIYESCLGEGHTGAGAYEGIQINHGAAAFPQKSVQESGAI